MSTETRRAQESEGRSELESVVRFQAGRKQGKGPTEVGVGVLASGGVAEVSRVCAEEL